MARLTKSFPVFDCDAHINDPEQIWEYVPASKRELVRRTYWRNDREAWLNGDTPVGGGGNEQFAGMMGYNPICIAGPQMNKKIMRKLNSLALTDEQRAYVHHDGALDLAVVNGRVARPGVTRRPGWPCTSAPVRMDPSGGPDPASGRATSQNVRATGQPECGRTPRRTCCCGQWLTGRNRTAHARRTICRATHR